MDPLSPHEHDDNHDDGDQDGPAAPTALTPTLFEHARRQKVDAIHAAADRNDLASLIAAGRSRAGFIDDAARRRCWPQLLGCTNHTPPADASTLPSHRDEGQVKLDVDRSFVYYPTGEGQKQLDKRRQHLQHLITGTLRRFPALSYFQGYHDIVQVLLLVLGPQDAPAAADRLSLLRIRDFMLPSMSATIPHLSLLPCILHAADPVLEQHVSVTRPFFALSATLTLYAHEIEEYSSIARLFDFLLATDASMPVYIFASIVLSRREELLEVDREDADIMHAILSKLPKPLNLEGLLERSLALHRQSPPQSLPRGVWSYIDRDSVLKTAQDPERVASQTLESGRAAFARQAERLRRQKLWQAGQAWVWRNRRRVASLALALTVALLSYYLQSRQDDYLGRIFARFTSLWPR